jgi:hypothetical protein
VCTQVILPVTCCCVAERQPPTFDGGADVAVLAPALAALLVNGPGGHVKAAGAHSSDDVAMAQRTGWRQRRQRALLLVGQELQGAGDLAAAVR